MATLKHHFIATTYERKPYRGGTTITLKLAEIIKKGEIKQWGFVTYNSGSCRGDASEAWVKLQELKAVKPAIIKKIVNEKLGNYSHEGIDQYYYRDYADSVGVKLEVL